MRRVAILVTACTLVFLCAGVAAAGETSVGGTIKFFLYDQSDGEITYWDESEPPAEVTESSKNTTSAGFSHGILNFYREITDDWAVEVQPEIAFRTGATPKLGATEITRSPSSSEGVEFVRAAAIWQMPADFEMKAGYLKPLFCWDYGYELFWDEQLNAFFPVANGLLGAWHDVGVEFYKNFETDSASFPTYLYVVNGPDGEVSGDNNDDWTFLASTQPELMGGNLKFLGSFGYGPYDDDGKNNMTRYAVGGDYTHGPFNIRAEYLGATYEKMIEVRAVEDGPVVSYEDGTPWGWYAKVFYNVTPTWALMGGYSQLEENRASETVELVDTYDQWTLGANWQPADGVTFMFSYATNEGERKTPTGMTSLDETTLKYGRLNLGVLATF